MKPLDKKLRLYNSDYFLYVTIMLFALYYIGYAISLSVFSDDRFVTGQSYSLLHIIFNKDIWVGLYATVGAILATAATFFSIKMTRIAMAAGMMISSAWAYGLLGASIGGSDVNFGAVLTYLLAVALLYRLMLRKTVAN